MLKLPSISKKVRWRRVRPTSSMSGVRKQRWLVVRRSAGGASRPRKYGLSGCIPAIVSSVEVSSGAGTSDADGRRTCPRSSKKRRNVSRISSAFTADSLGRVDPPPSHHQIAVHQTRGLARGDAVGGLDEVEPQAVLGPRRARGGAGAATP